MQKSDLMTIIGFDSETYLKREGKFLSHAFLSAQFFSSELNFNNFEINPEKVASYFTHRTRSAIFLSLNAEFDFTVLCKIIDLKKFQPILCYNKGRFMFGKLKYRDQTKRAVWHFYDLGNIFTNWSLAKIGDFLRLSKLEKPEYLGERKPKTPLEWAYFTQYALRDAEICYEAGKWLIEKFGELRVSSPSLAFSYFNKKHTPKGLYLRVEPEITQKLRLAYRGGRCESWIRGSPDRIIYGYDKVSLYPSVMLKKPFPKGINGLKRKTSINLCHDGIANCTVKQDAEIPFLGLKTLCSDGNIKLLFPNGVFTSWFTYPELRYFSLKRLGKILKVHEAYETEGCHFYFKSYVNEFFKLKVEDFEHADFWKLFMTSLYGKFAQDALSPLDTIKADGSKEKMTSPTRKKEQFLTNILVSAYITAYSRIDMHREYCDLGAENLVYTDTDSIHSFKPISKLGKGLGDLDFYASGKATYLRSKFYILGDKVRCRGMERIFTAEHVRKMIENNDVTIISKTLLRLRSAYRQHKPFLTQLKSVKHFSLEPDAKRVYLKSLKGSELLTSYTTSEAVILNGSA